jgi:hypothetical protein
MKGMLDITPALAGITILGSSFFASLEAGFALLAVFLDPRIVDPALRFAARHGLLSIRVYHGPRIAAEGENAFPKLEGSPHVPITSRDTKRPMFGSRSRLRK